MSFERLNEVVDALLVGFSFVSSESERDAVDYLCDELVEDRRTDSVVDAVLGAAGTEFMEVLFGDSEFNLAGFARGIREVRVF